MTIDRPERKLYYSLIKVLLGVEYNFEFIFVKILGIIAIFEMVW